MPANDYIRSHSFFKHNDYIGGVSPGDFGLIKLEHPFKRRERNGAQYVANIICLPVRGFKLKGTEIAKIAGSGPGLDRVKTGSIRLKEIPSSHLNREYTDFGSLICEVSSYSPIYLVQ